MESELKKISILWILMTAALLVHGQLHFFESSDVPKQETAMLIFFSLCYLIPMVMAFLSLILKDSVNRWLNIIVGCVFLLMNLYHTYGHIKEPHQLPIMLWTVLIAVLIILYSWKQSVPLKKNSS